MLPVHVDLLSALKWSISAGGAAESKGFFGLKFQTKGIFLGL